jgi:ParB/RepB/Spo0J family partition protein
MAKAKPRVNLARSVQPQKGDLEKLFTTSEDAEQAAGLQLLSVRVDAIRPDPEQPRRTFADDSLQELSDSIRQDGVIQPIEVTEFAPNRYMIVHGERRWRAARLADLETIPAVVRRRDYDAVTRFVRQLVENIQREDLNDIDRALGMVRLRDLLQEEVSALAHGRDEKQSWSRTVSWADVGRRLGYSRQRLNQLTSLLELPEEIQNAVRAGRLSERDARIYKGLPAALQSELHEARQAAELTATEAQQVAQRLKQEPSRRVVEIIEVVRRTLEPNNERVLGTSFESPAAPGDGRIRPIAPPAEPIEPDPDWGEKQSGGRKNALNINRVHWARDHLSRMQLQGLGGRERRELLNVLVGLQRDIEAFIGTLSQETPVEATVAVEATPVEATPVEATAVEATAVEATVTIKDTNAANETNKGNSA